MKHNASVESAESNFKSLKSRINQLRNSAKTRNIEVRLMDYEYNNLLNIGCHYCGKELLTENGYCLDRVDSNKGYTLYNVVGCCKICNRAKSDMHFLDYINWIEKSYKFQQSVIERLKNEERIYSYKEEKELHKLTKNDTSFFINSKRIK